MKPNLEPKEHNYTTTQMAKSKLERENHYNYLNSHIVAMEEPKMVHLLRGFADYRPSSYVLDAIQQRVHMDETEHHGHADQSHSFFVIDLERVREKHRVWKQNFGDVTPYYAVKANPNPAILRLMAHELKMSFDCASQSEIESILSLGVSPNRIIYANPCKPLSHIDYARRRGVFRTTFDSESELYKLRNLSDAPWELILRIWVNDKDSQCPLSNKYGAYPDDCHKLFQLAKALGLQITGLSFHVGSGAKSSLYREALHSALHVFNLGFQYGHTLRTLDIGGGFPGTCETDSSKGSSLTSIASLMRPKLNKNWKGVELIAEPGRFFCAEAQTLVTQIIGKRMRTNAEHQMIREYYINDGIYQSFNCMLYDHSVLLPEVSGSSPKYSSAIFGQTCDGLDQISKAILLPELRVGDSLVFPSMGAYTNGASSKFNGFRLSEWIAVDGDVTLI